MTTSAATSGMGTRLKRGDGGSGAGTQASKTFGTSNQQLKLLARIAGDEGNSKTASLTVSGTASYSQTITRNTVDIVSASTTGTATTTVAQAISSLYDDETFKKYWEATVSSGNGTGVLVAGVSGALSGGADGTEVFTACSEVRSISGPGRAMAPVEVTHMLSTDSYREYIAGLKDSGELTFDMNFINDASQSSLFTDYEDRVARNFQLVFETEADGDVTYQFTGLITKFEMNFQMEAAITASVAIKITGPIDDVTP